MGTALIQIETDRDRECRSWTTLSGSAVIQLVVTASQNSPAASQDARTLYDLLLAEVRRAGAQPEPAKCCGISPFAVAGCAALGYSGSVRRGLVWVSDSQCGSPNVGHTVFPWDFVLPVLPNGTLASLLPTGIATTLAQSYAPGQVGDAIPNILIQSGLSLDSFRVFISYRWDDAGAVAQQLFDGLSHAQFDVYLDRFRTNPGTNFLERIRFELADKACVVLLDSRDVGKSDWVRGEYAFARCYKLGLIAIDLPDGNQNFRRIGTRIDLRNTFLPASSFTGTTALPQPVIDKAVAQIRAHYATEVSRRFRHQRQLIRSAAVLAGAQHNLRADGYFDVHSPSYVVGATARPPSLAAFRSVSEAAASGRSLAKAVVVGPLFAQSKSASQDIKWLARATGSAVVNERRVLKAMHRMKAGSL